MFRALVLLLAAVVFAPSVAAAQQPCTTDARHVVNELYRHMLERQADAGSQEWVTQLQAGRMTVREVVHRIADSPEYSKRFVYTENGEAYPHERSVARLYRHLLGRQPDAEGQRAFANIAQREGAEAVTHRIIDSREYNQQLGDWGAPGSGGVRYCGNNNVRSQSTESPSNNSVVPVGQRRFRGMDRNNDGVVSREEWRGNAVAFQNADWNNDGVISGTEMNMTIDREGRASRDANFNRADRFANLDVNNNGQIEAREWDGNAAAFNSLDVNNDDRISEAEFAGQVVASQAATATSGQSIIVDARQRWIDTGINVTQGALVMFDVTGDVRLSDDQNDLAGAAGARSGRRAPEAPLARQAAGALIGRIGNGEVFGIGNQRSIRAPGTGRLYLSVNDDYLADNAGHFEVQVNVP